VNYKDTAKRLLNGGLIKKQEVNFNQIDALLFRAKKDLIASKVNLEIDEEVTYNYTYLAMIRCGRAIMFMEGYRPTDGQQHKTVIELAGKILGEEKFINIVKKFDNMRRKRNQFTYDPSLPVSKLEAKNALKTAEEFVKKIIEFRGSENSTFSKWNVNNVL